MGNMKSLQERIEAVLHDPNDVAMIMKELAVEDRKMALKRLRENYGEPPKDEITLHERREG